MPSPGQANNPEGVNAFSGPHGEKDPAYGQIEREKALTSAAPVGIPDPASIAKRAQRRGASGRGGSGAPSPPVLHPEAIAGAGHDNQQTMFWQAVLSDPGASPLTRQYAEQALGVLA